MLQAHSSTYTCCAFTLTLMLLIHSMLLLLLLFMFYRSLPFPICLKYPDVELQERRIRFLDTGVSLLGLSIFRNPTILALRYVKIHKISSASVYIVYYSANKPTLQTAVRLAVPTSKEIHHDIEKITCSFYISNNYKLGNF